MKHHAFSLLICGLAAACFTAGTASAQPSAAPWSVAPSVQLHHGGVWSSDPLMRELRLRARPGHFTLAGTLERETVRNTSGRPLSVCLGDAQGQPVHAGWTRDNTVPLAVSWDGGKALLRPGDCVHVDAARAVLRPAAQMPAGVVLRGRVGLDDGV